MGGTPRKFIRCKSKQTSFDQWGAGSATNYLADSLSKPAVYVHLSNASNNVKCRNQPEYNDHQNAPHADMSNTEDYWKRY